MADVNDDELDEQIQIQSTTDPSVFQTLNSDRFHPPVTVESANFILPEDQLEVHIVPREKSLKIVKYALRTGPLYLTTCYEEFSRKLISIHIASESSSSVELEKVITDNTDNNAPQNLLKYYNPGYDYWKSTFKRSPSDPKLFNGEDSTLNFNVLMKLHKCNIKQKCFEPIFGSVCLYAFFNDELIRITETFYFDATPEPIRLQYKKVYQREGQDPNHHTLYGTSINIGDATQINPHLNMFLLSLPKEIRFQEVYLIVQLNKVMTNEPDKSILPYCKGGTGVEQQKLKESSDRLNKFRQPLAFGIAKLFDSNGQLGGSSGGGNLSFPLFAQKLCFTDVAFAQAIKEMFPADGSAPYLRFEQIEIDMHLTTYDLGTSDQMLDRIRELGIIPDGERPHIIDSELPSEMSQLVFAPEGFKLDHLGKRSGALAIRKVATLIPSTIPWMKSLSRQIKTKVENSLFLYVLQFDKFPSSARNLTLKIELVEFKAQLPEQRPPTENTLHDIIPAIYNTTTLVGPHLVKEAYSRISYHIKNSPANDEFKIRLPDVLTSRHWIKVSVYHVHVKTHNRASLMNTILRPSNEKESSGDSNCLGVGFLPLHTAGGALIPDLEHTVPIYPLPNSGAEQMVEIPVVKLRTRALCSLVSSDRQIQSLIRNIPLPLGWLPSSIMPEAIAAQLIMKSSAIRPKEETLEVNLEELPKANALEMSQHFLVIMRTLTRSLLAGTCVFDETYANPFKHCKARCRAFLTLLKVLDKIIQAVGPGLEDEKESIMEAYVDFVLDEEVPLEFIANATSGTERLSVYVDSFAGLDGAATTAKETVSKGQSIGNAKLSFGPDENVMAKKSGSSSNLLTRSRKNSLDIISTENVAPSIVEMKTNGSDDGSHSSDYSEHNANDVRAAKLQTAAENLSSEPLTSLPLTSVPPLQLSSSPHRPSVTADSSGVVVNATAEISELDSDGFSKRASRRFSEEDSIASKRKSWGKYLTDSHWSTGKFVPINEISDDVDSIATIQSNAYLDAITSHIINQAIRVIEETLIGIAVYAMSSIIRSNTERNEVDDITESSILDIKPTRYSTKAGDNYGFPFRKYPDSRGSVDFRVKHDLLIEDTLAEELVSKSSWVHPLLDSTSLPIPIASPLYDSLAGYRERAVNFDDPSAAIGKHWWPWLYEVLTFQWGAVLALILSSLQLISSSNLESIVGSYQFEYELAQNNDKRDWRTILMEQGPLLLRMIYKSLALRIQRERKRAPVLLDEQYFNALENLVMLIAVEASTTVVGLWRSKKIITSLSHFLRSLFSLVTPSQVMRLLRSFFKTIRKSRGKNEEVDLRLLMIEELTLFDYFVALNLPYSLDAPVHCFSFNCIDSTPSLASINPYTSVGLRFETAQKPYSLVHLLIGEIIFSCRQDYRKSEKAWEILRDLAVRHAYDQRFQSKEAQQRIVCMYLPLIHEITAEVNHLAGLKHNSAERREALSILLYVLGGTPVRLLRSRIRTVSAQVYQTTTDTILKPSNTTAESIAASKTGSANISSANKTYNINPFNTDKFIPPTKFGNSFIIDFLRTLHLLIDTFEIPYYLNNASSSKDELYLKLLSPSVVLDNTARAEINQNSGRKFSMSDTIPAPAQRQSLLANLTSLDQRMQSRKTAAITSRKSAGAVKEGERGWIEHTRKVANERSNDRSVLIKPISKEDAQFCAEKFSASATKIMLSVMWIILEECPKIIIQHQENNASTITPTPLRQNCIEEAIVCSQEEKELAAFLRQALCVPLHALYCNQVDSALAEIYSFISSIVKRFGAKMFLVSLEDSLQYWLRITLIHFASDSLLVRHTACNFFLTLLDATFQHFGTFAAISTTVLAILNDVTSEILEWNKSSIQTYSDEDRALQGLIDAFREIRETAEKNIHRNPVPPRSPKKGGPRVAVTGVQRVHPMSVSLIQFVKSVEIIFRANADVRRYLSLPAGYDFFGANLLDGPFDDRTSLLLQVLRQNRRNVKNDLAESSNKTSTQFQLEEVMMHFVEAAEVYDVHKLPRFKMQWLENLARLHQSKSNRAEGAEIRWRIFKICQQVEDRWQRLWSPRPPLQWQRRGKASGDSSVAASDVDGNRDFYRVLTTALDSRTLHPWLDMNQFWTHKITALTVSRQFYSSANLISLAERGSTQLIQLYRLTQQTSEMIEEYTTLANYWKTAIEKGITNSMALGTFYRVFYTGQGAPPHLREKEFIFRNANHLHVSEFHTLVTSHLKSIVAEGVEVKMIQDITAAQDLRESNAALIVMNSVKPINAHVNSANSYKLIHSPDDATRSAKNTQQQLISGNSTELIDQFNYLATFQYSVPFTQDGTKAHAKKMDEQWTKYTVLTVKDSFPYILTRQLVIKREVTILSPIEVAIHDIEERIESMERELEFTPKTQSDNNNMMRIVQGTVLPQVNAGAAEVAKVFLHPDKILRDLEEIQKKIHGITSNDIKLKEQRYQLILLQLQDDLAHYHQHVHQLKITLINFLQYSKLLLLKCRNILVADQSILDKDKSKVLEIASTASPSQKNHLNEMNELIPLTYPSLMLVGNNNPLQSMNLNFLSSSGLLSNGNININGISGGGSGGGNAGGVGGIGGSNGNQGNSGGGAVGGGNNAPAPPAPMSTQLSSLWKGTENNGGNTGNNAMNQNNGVGAAGNGNSGGNLPQVALTPQEINNIKWQIEMEKGFDVLVQTIYPFISDVKEAEVFNIQK